MKHTADTRELQVVAGRESASVNAMAVHAHDASDLVVDGGDETRADVRSRTAGDGPARRPRLVGMPAYGDVSAAAGGTVAVELAPTPRRRAALAARHGAWSLFSDARWQWLQLAVDLVVLSVAVALAASIADSSSAVEGSQHLIAAIWFFPVLAVGALWQRGMYGARSPHRMVDVLLRGAAAVALATVALVAAAAFAGLQHSTPLALRLGLFACVAVCLGHTALLYGQRHARRAGRAGGRALVVGAGVIGTRVVQDLREHPQYGVVPVGMLDVKPRVSNGDSAVPVLGPPDDIVQVAHEMRADHVILAFSNVPDHELLTQVRHCQDAGMRVSLVPRLFESLNERVEVSHVGTLPIMSLHRVDPKGWQFRLKYVLDRIIAAVALVALLPLFLVVAALVRLTSAGPVLFRQRRVGLDGRPFDLLKFRSMRMPCEETPFVPYTGLAPGGIEGVDRRTPVGRLLRRTFIDELPQLINVLRGEMSLVGPRPERPQFVELFESQVTRYGDRHRAKAGITGWAQVHGLRGQTSVAQRIAYDNHYIDNWSLAMDVKIVLLTAAAVLSNKTD